LHPFSFDGECAANLMKKNDVDGFIFAVGQFIVLFSTIFRLLTNIAAVDKFFLLGL